MRENSAWMRAKNLLPALIFITVDIVGLLVASGLIIGSITSSIIRPNKMPERRRRKSSRKKEAGEEVAAHFP